jgi:hypothetical protein
VFGDFGIGQPIQAPCDPLQFASLVQPDQELWRPAVLAHICSPEYALASCQFEYVVGLSHETSKFHIHITFFQVM